MTAVNYEHGLDMQQVFAQLAVEFEAGEPWWLTKPEEDWLEEHNKAHRSVSALRERLLDKLDLDPSHQSRAQARTSTEVLQALWITNPTNTQSKECVGILRELVGDSKKINGLQKWRVLFRENEPQDDDDRY